MPCRAVLTGQTCKYGANCHFAHEPTTLTKLLDLLNNTKKSMDICLYTITCNEICDAVRHQKRGGITQMSGGIMDLKSQPLCHNRLAPLLFLITCFFSIYLIY